MGTLYPMVPRQEDIDRWWGCEINFEPELDECLKVRNIKRGARPTKELSDVLKEILRPKILELRKEVQNYWKTRIPADIVKHIDKITLSLMEQNNSVSALEVENLLSGMETSIDNISRIIENLAVENRWDWTTNGTYRTYYAHSPQRLAKLESERKTCFKSIRRAIESSNIDQKFKDVALYDLDQAKASYKKRAFKASIVMFGAIVEGLMLGVIRTNTVLKPMMMNPRSAPQIIQNLGLRQFSQPEDLGDIFREDLKFEDYKNIIVHLKKGERLEVERIQDLRNTIRSMESNQRTTCF